MIPLFLHFKFFLRNLVWQNVGLALLPKGNPGATSVSTTFGNTFCRWLDKVKETTELELTLDLHLICQFQ